MKGSIVERSPGHFAIILETRDEATGKRKRKWHSFNGTKRAAQIECARLVSELKGGTYALRPIRPADALLYPDFMARVDPDDVRLRFLAPRRNFPDEFALRLTQLDYDRDMAFVAIAPDGALAGVSRVSCDPDHTRGEYALLVRSDLQGRGIGSALLGILIDYARVDGLERLEGVVLAENRGMLDLIKRFGFEVAFDPDDPGVVLSRLAL